MKRALAEIRLPGIVKNVGAVRAYLAPATEIMGVVKADAYGHGAVTVARTLLRHGVGYFGVAWVSEADELRRNGITAPILVLSEPDVQYIPKIVEQQLVQTVYRESFVEALSRTAGKQTVKVHIKVDTGMNRIGVAPEQLPRLLEKIKKLKNIEIEGLFTHFSCADQKDNPLNKKQIRLFDGLVAEVKRDIELRYVHMANSAAAENFPQVHYDMIRLGIGMYRGVMTFRSRVMYVKDVPANQPVSYGATYTTKQQTRIATISVGYADGYDRHLSNRGTVLIRGQRFPIVGVVCMDMCMVDVTGSAVAEGDSVVLIGTDGKETITAQDVATLVGTIDYEIMCGISKRVPRIYIEE
jgi:alanine racemase